MVRPMALAAVDRELASSWRFGSLRAAREQSSAKRKSRARASRTLVLAFKRLSSKESAITSVADGDASIWGGECIKQHGSEHKKRWSQCTALLDAIEVWEWVGTKPFSTMQVILLSWKDLMMLRSLSGQPSLRSMAHRPSRPTLSKALVRYTKRMHRFWFCSRHFSLICRTANIVSIVPLFLLKAHWLSDTTSSKRWCVIQFSMIPAKIFPGILNNEMPLWLSQDVLVQQVDDVGVREFLRH